MRAMGAAAVVMLACLPCVGVGARAQGSLPPATGTPGVPGEMRTVDGRVLRGGSGDPAPVSGVYVVLHRIAADAAGPVDSVRTTDGGRYRFRYRLESTSAMYIISTRHDGVAYFSSPLRDAAVRGADADLVVYDTTSSPFPLTVRSRHFVVSPPDESGLRRVVDVFEVANDSARTLVAGNGAGTWRVRLPEGVRDPQSSGGDLPAEALVFTDGAVTLQAPFPPGSRQLVMSYGIPPSAPVVVPVDDATARVEVLVEGAGATVGGSALAAQAPVTMEGRTFQRFVGGPMPAGTTFRLSWSGGGLGGRAGKVALLAIAGVAVALGVLYGRRNLSTADVVRAADPRSEAESLARAIAALDRLYADPGRHDQAELDAYRSRRADLKESLVAVLAVEDGTRTT